MDESGHRADQVRGGNKGLGILGGRPLSRLRRGLAAHQLVQRIEEEKVNRPALCDRGKGSKARVIQEAAEIRQQRPSSGRPRGLDLVTHFLVPGEQLVQNHLLIAALLPESVQLREGRRRIVLQRELFLLVPRLQLCLAAAAFLLDAVAVRLRLGEGPLVAGLQVFDRLFARGAIRIRLPSEGGELRVPLRRVLRLQRLDTGRHCLGGKAAGLQLRTLVLQ